MRKYVTALAAITAVASGVAVLQLKAAVQSELDDVKALAQQIHEDQEAIRVIEAEWAYLTTPRILQERSIQFLALMPPRAKQIVSDPSLVPFRPKGLEVEPDPGVLLPVSHEKKENLKVKKDKDTKKKGHNL